VPKLIALTELTQLTHFFSIPFSLLFFLSGQKNVGIQHQRRQPRSISKGLPTKRPAREMTFRLFKLYCCTNTDMANPEHLARVNEGVSMWNYWRRPYKYDGTVRSLLGGERAPDLSGWDARSLRTFDFQRFIENYVPHPGETKHLYEDVQDGSLSPELQRYGWQTLNDFDLSRTDLTGSNLSGIALRRSNLEGADLSSADLRGADLSEAKLQGAVLRGADLSGARCFSTNFSEADLTCATFRSAELAASIFSSTKLIEADLTNADLQMAKLVGTDLTGATLSECRVYGISTWDLRLVSTIQKDLVITQSNQPVITVDNIEVAQFIYLLLNNSKLRGVIDSITSKAVLILGRFTTDRKATLDAIRDALRKRGFLPIMFDFERPSSRDFSETVSTLAHLSRFVIADLTDARSVPQELTWIIPKLLSVPICPLLLGTETEWAMFSDLARFPQVLPPIHYTNHKALLDRIEIEIIDRAERRATELVPR